ncbi:MAG: Crp/Fnr family transcriptional regulator, partial [Janthinobacterium lividum]
RVPLPVRHRLSIAGSVIEDVYFPEDGVVSIVAMGKGGRQFEVGVFGREGMSGTALILGADRTPHQVYMQIAGQSGLRLPATALAAVLEQSRAMDLLFRRYAQALLVQVSASAAAAAGHTIDQRLARWLLMCHDRMDGDELILTHEFMAMMLSSRRASVTEALHILEGERMIGTERGVVIIRDRAALESRAGDGYGAAEAEYKRLIGTTLRRSEVDGDRRGVNGRSDGSNGGFSPAEA